MRSKFFALFAVSAMLLNLAGFAMADTHRRKGKKRQVNPLVALLPAADGVATVDARRLLTEAIPQILSASQPMLRSIMKPLEEMQAKTGIDLKKFETIAIGLTVAKTADNKFDMDPVVIARGDVRSGSLVAIAKIASNGTYREEKFGERTIYIFSAKDIANKTAAKTAPAATASAIGGVIDDLTKEMAVASLDDTTLVLGSPALVRETLEGKTHVSPEVTSLLGGRESAVINFAMRSPDGMSSLLPVDNDEIGANVNSIRYISGSMDVNAAGTSFQVAAKTNDAKQAESLYNTLDGLKNLGKVFLGSSKRADQRLYARLIDSAKVGLRGSTVSIDLLISQADTDALVATIK